MDNLNNFRWRDMAEHTQLKILVSGLSYLWVINICKDFENLAIDFLPEVIMIKKSCNLIGQEHLDDIT